jgi:hypothetical protein
MRLVDLSGIKGGTRNCVYVYNTTELLKTLRSGLAATHAGD